MQLTPGLEKMILEGRAEYKTLSMAGFNEMIIPVPDKTYIVILGYEYLPFAPLVGTNILQFEYTLVDISFLVQYLNFVCSGNFYPFAHYLNYNTNVLTYNQNPDQLNDYFIDRAAYDHQHRTTYMISKQDVAVYATKMNTQALAQNSAVIPINGNIKNVLGYGGVTGLYNLANYVDVGAGRLYPMTDKYTQGFLDPNPSRYSQAFSVFGGANPADAWIDIPAMIGNDYGKARLNHVTIHYVKVNAEPPANLI